LRKGFYAFSQNYVNEFFSKNTFSLWEKAGMRVQDNSFFLREKAGMRA